MGSHMLTIFRYLLVQLPYVHEKKLLSKIRDERSFSYLTLFLGNTLFSLLPCRVSLDRVEPDDTLVSMCSAFSISNASNFSITWDRLKDKKGNLGHSAQGKRCHP